MWREWFLRAQTRAECSGAEFSQYSKTSFEIPLQWNAATNDSGVAVKNAGSTGGNGVLTRWRNLEFIVKFESLYKDKASE